MFCSSCGKEIPGDSTFCPECGATLGNAPAKASSEQGWSTGVLVALAIGTLIIPLIGIILGAMNLKDDNKKSQALGLLIFGLVMAVIYLASA